MIGITVVKNFFEKGSTRSVAAKKNIILSFLIKGGNILISFLLVPLTLNYLNASEYGIWLTLSSILIWINYFDIGLANGLRNKLTTALALNNKQLGQIYVSTTFALLAVIMLVLFFAFFTLNPFLEWNRILNTDEALGNKLSKLVIIVFAFFCLQFILKTVGIILIADQKPSYNDLISVSGNLLSLLVIFLLTKFTPGSLWNVAVVFSAAPCIIFLIASLILFLGKYKYLRPTISAVQFKYTKDLIGLGIQFLIIQIAVCVVVYTSTNVIIAQLFNNESVTIYNIAYKYFYSLAMAYIIIIMPFWSASTDAYTKKDFQWIESSIKKLLIIFFASCIVLLFMLLFANKIYCMWVGNGIHIPISLSASVALYVALFNWSNTFIYFINGIGKIRLQLYASVIVAFIYIPLATYLGRDFGVNGVVWAACISLLPTSILIPMQCRKLYSQKAHGIWNR